jgi:hypothetical protein
MHAGDTLVITAQYNSGDGSLIGEGCSGVIYTTANQPASFAWSSSDTTVFTVDAGRLVAHGVGAATMRVQSGESALLTLVTVLAPTSSR